MIHGDICKGQAACVPFFYWPLTDDAEPSAPRQVAIVWLCFATISRQVVAQKHDMIFTDFHHAHSTLYILSGSSLGRETRPAGGHSKGSPTDRPPHNL